MKKLSVLLIAMFFCLLSMGTAMAEMPQTSVLDRNAVWTNWIHKSGDFSEPDKAEGFASGKAIQISTNNDRSDQDQGMNFDFIRETKSYDYDKDSGLST